MKDKYRAYLWAVFCVFIVWNFVDSIDQFISLFGLPEWAETLVLILPVVLPIAYWLRNERGPGPIGIALAFIIGILIGKRID